MNKPRVLIVEDNFITADELRQRLSDNNYRTELALSGTEALRKAEEFDPELLLIDINLGKYIDGIETTEKIQAARDIPVIYLTAYDDDETLKRAKATGPYAYLLKPLDEKELRVAIEIALFRHKISSELNSVNRQLQESNSQKDRLFSVIAHDLRGPVGNTREMSHLLLEDYDEFSREDIKKYIQFIHNSADHTYKLLSELLTWARNRSGTISFNPESVEIVKLVNTVVDSFSETLALKNISIKTVYSENAITETVDYEMIRTVMRNLISNAIKFSDSGSAIEVRAEKNSQNRLVLSVKDEGIGISEEIQKKLFIIGEKTSMKGTSGEKGTGLGLILCHDFIEKHGGEIKVESLPGEGSTFTVII